MQVFRYFPHPCLAPMGGALSNREGGGATPPMTLGNMREQAVHRPTPFSHNEPPGD